MVEGAAHLTKPESLDQLMSVLYWPEMYYPCPPELAEKAVLPDQALTTVGK